jgi:galactokinase
MHQLAQFIPHPDFLRMPTRKLKVSTPGRVCLFGEHQDYLMLPVIPCAISLRVTIEGSARIDRSIRIDLPDIHSKLEFPLDTTLPYVVERDYYRSVINVLKKHGYAFSHGFDCTVTGNIPINAGTSSSSALVVSWVNFLSRMADEPRALAPVELGKLAHEAEVLEFGEPGGMMDQYSTAVGGVCAIDFFPEVKVEQLNVALKQFVIGDSGEPKDTKHILARVKNQVIAVTKALEQQHPGFSLHTTTVDALETFKTELSTEQFELLTGTIRNREITREARTLMQRTPLDHQKLGALLSEHQNYLRDVQKISTPKIDRMLEAAMKAGAYGGKINGSGGGGCMFAYAPENPELVAEAIERDGGKAYIVSADEGSRAEFI